MRKIRLLLYMPSFGFGGIEKVFLSLADGFKDELDVFVYALTVLEDSSIEQFSRSAKVIETGLGINLLKHRYLFRNIHELMRIVRDVKPDILISAYPRVNAATGLALKLIPADQRPKWILTEHGDTNLYLGNGIKRLVKQLILRTAASSADGYVAVSSHVGHVAAGIYGIERFLILRNPTFDTEHVKNLAKEPCDHPWFTGDHPVIVSAGRLTTSKDFSTLLRAFSRIVDRFSARLVILGDGSERNRLLSLASSLNISDSVWIPGFVDNPIKYFSRATMFVLPSLSEGQPLVILEAMTAGIPVITTSYPGVEEMVTHNVNGLVVPGGDDESMAEAITELMCSSRLREKLTENASKGLHVFQRDVILNDYRELVMQVLLGASKSALRGQSV